MSSTICVRWIFVLSTVVPTRAFQTKQSHAIQQWMRSQRLADVSIFDDEGVRGLTWSHKKHHFNKFILRHHPLWRTVVSSSSSSTGRFRRFLEPSATLLYDSNRGSEDLMKNQVLPEEPLLLSEEGQDWLYDRMNVLQEENRLLTETVQRLESQNAELLYEVMAARKQQKVVIENFEGPQEWCDSLEEGSCPVEPKVSFGQAFLDRACWLVGLLLMQSFSGIVLARNEALIADHPFIIYFLTMLVGAGGNAGNQASVRVIRGLALGTLNPKTQNQFLIREFKMAIALSCVLTLVGFFRAAAFSTPFPEALAVTLSLFLIVFTSICLGAVLPLALKRIHVDPAHSSTSIQVIMDILGVILAISVSNVLLGSPIGLFIMSKLGVKAL